MGVRSSQPRSPNLNKTDGHLLEYLRNTFGAGGGGTNAPPGAGGHSASGGVINDYTDPGTGNIYRSHVFTTSGSFVISQTGSSFGSTVDVTAIAGGGGGSGSMENYWAGCGGGAGGMLEVTGYPVSATTYPVVIGAGGLGSYRTPAPVTNGTAGNSGAPTTFNNPGATPVTIEALGGGFGGASGPSIPLNDCRNNTYGGSGGGVGSRPGLDPVAAPAITVSPKNPAVNALSGCTLNHYGNVGGSGQDGNTGEASGGGGAGGAGTGVTPPYNAGHSNAGGAGRANTFAYGPSNPVTYAAGGGGGPATSPGSTTTTRSNNGTFATGGGGAGGANPNGGSYGGNGGSGIVIVRYQIAETSTAKATGGSVSFYGGKTIHTFTGSGTFTVTSGPITAEMVIVAGGASGGSASGSWSGAGGGAGGVVIHPGISIANGPYAVTVGAGGAASDVQQDGNYVPGVQGSDSSVALPTTYTGSGGGYGGAGPSPTNGNPGGSGGGAAYSGNGGAKGVSQQPASNPGASEYGYAGGDGADRGAGGGGGAGGVGGGGGPGNPTATGGDGGAGIQLPSTFRDPDSTVGAPGPGGGGYWIAGGGGGGGKLSANTGGGGPGGPYAGGGNGGGTTTTTNGGNAVQNTGGGGGGSGNAPSPDGNDSGAGGSGIVLIAYPT